MRAIALVLVAAGAGCVGVIGSGDGAGSSECPPDQAFFVERLWQPTLATKCVGCHSAAGPAAGSRLVLDAAGDDAAHAKNLATLMRVAMIDEAGEPILLSRPGGRHPSGHLGGTLLAAGSAEAASFERFVARARGLDGACEAEPTAACNGESKPGRRRLRRLTHAEYDATVSDLFGIASTHGRGFAADVVVHGFDNDAAALVVTPIYADQVRQAAEAIAAEATAPGRLEALVSCPERGCVDTMLRGFGTRVYRRPLAEEEISRLLAVYDVGAGAGGGHGRGVALVLEAMLQSPSFLYRSELGVADGGRHALTSWEIASELSYFLWGTAPDAELLAAAAAGTLASDPAELERQARRLLASPRARQAVRRFGERWLAIDQLANVPKDGAVFPAFTPGLRAALADEAAAHVESVVFGGGGFAELLTAPLPAPAPGSELAGFYGGAGPARLGLLESGALLAMHAKPAASSPIHRGKVVRERLLCQTLPPPPPGVNAQPPAPDPTLTARERYAQHAADAACAGCHRLIDPIGFAFEHFDGVGRWRADENGLAIDDAGEIIASQSSDGAFTGTAGLAAHLAASDEARACFARTWTRWAWAAGDAADMTCAQDAVVAAWLAGSGSVEELILSIVLAEHFRFRDGE